MYLVISLLVLRAGYGIWLYQFLIIAYLFTFKNFNKKFNVLSNMDANADAVVTAIALPVLS